MERLEKLLFSDLVSKKVIEIKKNSKFMFGVTSQNRKMGNHEELK